jgi:hypothetical protein
MEKQTDRAVIDTKRVELSSRSPKFESFDNVYENNDFFGCVDSATLSLLFLKHSFRTRPLVVSGKAISLVLVDLSSHVMVFYLCAVSQAIHPIILCLDARQWICVCCWLSTQFLSVHTVLPFRYL